MEKPVNLGFVGAGRMATALARGFRSAGLVEPQQIVACDPYPAAGEEFVRVTGGKLVPTNAAVADASDVLFVAVKPQQMPQALAELKPRVSDRHLVISIAAGVRLDALAEGLGKGPRLVRVMPNTPCLVGQSASAYSLGPGTTAADDALVARLFGAVGIAHRLDEKLIDAVTGLSGSGPAFVYVLIEALSDGGVRMGLPRDVATQLAAQTVRGAAEMVLTTGEHPAALKDQVTSPGGTTIAGLQALEAAGFRGALISAVESATRRAVELGATPPTK